MIHCSWKPPKEIRKDTDFFNDYICPYDPDYRSSDGQPYCIFHLPLDDKKNIEGINQLIVDRFLEEWDKSKSAMYFPGLIFPPETDFSGRDFRHPFDKLPETPEEYKGILGPIFDGCYFGVNTLFSGAKFGSNTAFNHVVFEDGVKFNQTRFENGIRFDTVSFLGSTEFVDATFGIDTVFWHVFFEDGPSFQHANFGTEARFIQTIFGDNTSFGYSYLDYNPGFYESYFGENTDFSGAIFGPMASFVGSSFGHNTNFRHAVFSHSNDFSRAVFLGLTDFSFAKGHDWEKAKEIDRQVRPYVLREGIIRPTDLDIYFGRTRFEGPTFFRGVDLSTTKFVDVCLKWVSFLLANITKTRFVICKWPRAHGRHISFDEKIFKKKLREKSIVIKHYRSSKSQKVEELKLDEKLEGLAYTEWPFKYFLSEIHPAIEYVQPKFIEDVSLQIKQSLEESKSNITAGDFHFAAMEMRRLGSFRDKRYIRWFTLSIYKLISGYGERPLRALFVLTLLSTVVFPLVYKIVTNLCWWQSFYFSLYSIIPFKLHVSIVESAKNYIGGINPWVGFLSGFQTILSTAIFGLFALALRSRFKR